jgi:hypothetical protein
MRSDMVCPPAVIEQEYSGKRRESRPAQGRAAIRKLRSCGRTGCVRRSCRGRGRARCASSAACTSRVHFAGVIARSAGIWTVGVWCWLVQRSASGCVRCCVWNYCCAGCSGCICSGRHSGCCAWCALSLWLSLVVVTLHACIFFGTCECSHRKQQCSGDADGTFHSITLSKNCRFVRRPPAICTVRTSL